jgi:hypothetical protein
MLGDSEAVIGPGKLSLRHVVEVITAFPEAITKAQSAYTWDAGGEGGIGSWNSSWVG